MLLLATTGAFSVLTVVALPDAPLVAAWTWALCFLADAFLDGRERAWLPAGLCAGLAFDSKYTAAFLFLGAGVLLFLVPRGRRALGTPWPWLGLLTAGLATAPVWIWNAQHDWASFLFQTAGRVEHARGLSPWNLLGLVGSQAVLVLPPLLWAWGREAMHAIPRMVRGALPPEELFLAAFSFVPALVLVVVSLGAVVKPNWPLPLWVAGALWAARRSGPWLLRWNVAASALVHALVLVELFAYPVRLGDDTWVGWRSLREQTRARLAPESSPSPRTTTRPPPSCCSTERWRRTDEICSVSPHSSSTWWASTCARSRGGPACSSTPTAGDLTTGRPGRHRGHSFRGAHGSTEEPPLLVRRDERIVRRFRAWRCVGYRPPPGAPGL